MMNHPHCSSNTAGYILSKLRSIHCPEAVKDAIDEAWNSFQKGQLNIQKNEPRKVKFNRPLIIRLGLGVFGVVSIWVLFKWVFTTGELA
jgi:hypothetical protein